MELLESDILYINVDKSKLELFKNKLSTIAKENSYDYDILDEQDIDNKTIRLTIYIDRKYEYAVNQYLYFYDDIYNI